MITRPPHTRWPGVLLALHWVIAAALLAMVWSGFAMSSAAETAVQTGNWEARILGLSTLQAYQLHKSIGVTLCGLVIVALFAKHT